MPVMSRVTSGSAMGKQYGRLTTTHGLPLCICMNCQFPMQFGEHSKCPIELLACPEHRHEQFRRMGCHPDTGSQPPSGEVAGDRSRGDALNTRTKTTRS
jgi:hypothetical protein